MQFNILAFAVAAMAAVASANDVVTVYACSSTVTPTGGVAYPTGASTGGVTPPAPTGSPIPYVTNAGSVNGVSALGLIVAGGVALFL